MKSQLFLEFRARQSFYQLPLFSDAFTTSSNYTDHSLIQTPPSVWFHFFSICPSCLRSYHQSALSFLLFAENFSSKNAEQKREATVWNSRTDWTLIISVNPTRVPSASSTFFFRIRPFQRITSFVMRYHVARKEIREWEGGKNEDQKGTEIRKRDVYALGICK